MDWPEVMGRPFDCKDGRIMIMGGHQEIGKEFTEPTSTAEVIDLSLTNPSWQNVANMNQTKAYINAVMLPDGNVFVIGGHHKDDFVPELYQSGQQHLDADGGAYDRKRVSCDCNVVA